MTLTFERPIKHDEGDLKRSFNFAPSNDYAPTTPSNSRIIY